MRQFLPVCGALIAFSLALLFPGIVLEGARYGLNLWATTLVPTLLPFMILSNLFIRSGVILPLMAVPGRLSTRFLGISPAGLYAFLCGFFFGYPSGAKILADLLKTGQIEKEEAAWLVIFCNNASPAFLITYVLSEHMHHPELVQNTLLILYGVPAILCLIPRFFCRLNARGHRRKSPEAHTVSGAKKANDKPQASAQKPSFTLEMLDISIHDAIIVTLKLGGYVTLFAVLAKAVSSIHSLPQTWSGMIIAFLEITNGVPAIVQAFPFPLCLLVLLPFLAFGGMCSVMQTGSVIKDTPLSWRHYLCGKLLLSLPALLLGAVWLT